MSVRLVEVRYPFAEFKKGFTFEYEPDSNPTIDYYILEGFMAFKDEPVYEFGTAEVTEDKKKK